MACDRLLTAELEGSSLPRHARRRIDSMFRGRTFEKADLDKAVQEEKDYIASLSTPAIPDIGNQSRINVGYGTVEKVQRAVDRMFGLTVENLQAAARMERLDHQPMFPDLRAAQDQKFDGYSDIPVPKGIAELYVLLTGDPEVSGRFNRAGLPADLRASQDITSSTFSYILGNTLGRRLVTDYREPNYREDLLISMRKPVKDFRTQEAALVGYFGDLADIDPESGDYEEVSGITDVEATYVLGQKGNILTITRKTIINDDISLIIRLVPRLGRAARRTHAQYVWNMFINNANCAGGGAWFTSGQGNLGSSALAIATALTAYQWLAKTTEQDSGKRLGLLDDPSVKPVIVHPIDLMSEAQTVIDEEYYYASNDLTTKTKNPLYGKVQGACLSMLTDASDWGMIMPPNVIDVVEMGYLHGNQDPELFVADTPQSEQVFVADKIRHKIRHEYAGAPIDPNAAYKAVVA